MRTAHSTPSAFDRHFRSLRWAALFGMAILVAATIATVIFVYTSIRGPLHEANMLMRDTSLGSPHAVQRDRLEKVAAEWRRKQAAATSTLPAMRDLFAGGNAPEKK